MLQRKEIENSKLNLKVIKNKKKILLIESHPDMLKKNRSLLESMGYEVDIATTNEEMVRKSNIDYAAIFTRPYHEHINGWMGARLFMMRINIPKIFICSLHPDDESIRFFKRCGVDEVLKLPLTVEKVNRVLN